MVARAPIASVGLRVVQLLAVGRPRGVGCLPVRRNIELCACSLSRIFSATSAPETADTTLQGNALACHAS